MDYLHTPSKHWSLPYTEDETEFTVYATHGQHHSVHVEGAIHWFHGQDPARRVRVVWLNQPKAEENGNEERTPPDGGPKIGGVPGTPAEAVPPGEHPKLDEQLPPV